MAMLVNSVPLSETILVGRLRGSSHKQLCSLVDKTPNRQKPHQRTTEKSLIRIS
jgi:hypothetical protein